jgi:hypothetical protein
MKSNQEPGVRSSGLVGMLTLTKALVLWMMLISGIVLATRQARAADSVLKISLTSY